ncbi:CoA pyrophosphatase [Sharpea azabuensis]|uniref:NUDIX hydrolase n=1 Tax=Sharpea azabuensis TaxID=322505 RepID=UPI0013DC757F|nr:CoA pyrophosphatase [Sharpea azabuensis]
MQDILKKLQEESHKPTLAHNHKGASSILIPLIEEKGETYILYEVRSRHITQPLEVCFPGGRLEKHEKRKKAALRETCEELLVNEKQVEIISALDGHMSVNGRAIWPFIGILHDYHNTYSRDEVDHVFKVPLSYFLTHEPEVHKMVYKPFLEDNFPYELVGGKDYPFMTMKRDLLFYQYDGEVIWGITAEITYKFIQKIKQYRKSDD